MKISKLKRKQLLTEVKKKKKKKKRKEKKNYSMSKIFLRAGFEPAT